MDFATKYISTSEKLIDDKSTKVVISDEAFAIGEMLQQLAEILNRGVR